MLCQLKQVKKYFPVRKGLLTGSQTFVKAVDHVDFTINAGENIGLVGESGSGKTTLGRLLLKLIPLDSGQIIFDGQDLSRLNVRQMIPYRKQMQMVFQDPYNSLDPRFSIRRVMLEAMIFDKEASQKEKEKRIEEMLESLRLPTNILSRFPHEFSGGERQRIAIARSLIMKPKLLILDEAVSSLDVLIQEEILRLLMDLQKKMDVTYFFISHNLRVIKKISQKIAVMFNGKIVESAQADDLLENPIHPYTQELLAAALHYRSVPRTFSVNWGRETRLRDCGNNHFVIGE